MIVAPLPLWYSRLVRPGDWRLSVQWLNRFRWTRRVDTFPEGTVYRLWLGVVLVKLMVKA